MILTLKELANYLRVHERTVLRMLKAGQIKGTKIGGQWRFNGSQIDGLFFPEGAEGKLEVPLADLVRSHLGITMSRILRPERMSMDIHAADTEGVLNELAGASVFNTLLLDRQDFLAKLVQREKLLSTGIGNGIAIPHPRDPIPTLREPAVVVFGRSQKGVDWLAADGQKVNLFFLLACQNIELHLHLMGRLAQLLRVESFVAGCRACETSEDVMRLVMECERQQFLGEAKA